MDGNDSDYDPKKEAKKEVIMFPRVLIINCPTNPLKKNE